MDRKYPLIAERDQSVGKVLLFKIWMQKKAEYVMDKWGKENSCFPSPKPLSFALLNEKRRIPLVATSGKGLCPLTPQAFEKT